MEWQEIISNILENTGWQLSYLSDLLNVDYKYLHAIKNGKSRNPKTEFIKKLVKTIGINPTWLLTGEGEMFLPGKDPCQKSDTVSLLDTAAPEAPRQAAVPLPAGSEPPKRIRRISMELQGLADELDVGGPVPARLRPLVRRVARLDDEDLAKTTAYVDDLLQKVKYAQGDELANSDAIQGGAEAGIA